MYVLALVSVVVMGLAAAQATTSWSTAIRREREAELAFRLGEYRRAIAAYRAANERWPASLEDLVVDPGRLERRRYLRRLYPDPLTGEADWELVVVRDGAGRPAGIKDVRSRSDASPLRLIDGKSTYRDW